MIQYFSDLIDKHRESAILVDSNIFLLLIIGRINPKFIEKFPRTSKFTEKDFLISREIINKFKIIRTNPQIITEVNNLANKLDGNYLELFYDFFSENIVEYEETYIPSKALIKSPGFNKFGITDICIKKISEENILVFTSDFPLSQFLQSNGLDVININHLRPYYLDIFH